MMIFQIKVPYCIIIAVYNILNSFHPLALVTLYCVPLVWQYIFSLHIFTIPNCGLHPKTNIHYARLQRDPVLSISANICVSVRVLNEVLIWKRTNESKSTKLIKSSSSCYGSRRHVQASECQPIMELAERTY